MGLFFIGLFVGIYWYVDAVETNRREMDKEYNNWKQKNKEWEERYHGSEE